MNAWVVLPAYHEAGNHERLVTDDQVWRDPDVPISFRCNEVRSNLGWREAVLGAASLPRV